MDWINSGLGCLLWAAITVNVISAIMIWRQRRQYRRARQIMLWMSLQIQFMDRPVVRLWMHVLMHDEMMNSHDYMNWIEQREAEALARKEWIRSCLKQVASKMGVRRSS